MGKRRGFPLEKEPQMVGTTTSLWMVQGEKKCPPTGGTTGAGIDVPMFHITQLTWGYNLQQIWGPVMFKITQLLGHLHTFTKP